MKPNDVLNDFIEQNNSRYFTFPDLEQYMERTYKDPMPILCANILGLECIEEVGDLWYEAVPYERQFGVFMWVFVCLALSAAITVCLVSL